MQTAPYPLPNGQQKFSARRPRRGTLDPRKARYTLGFVLILASILGSFLLVNPVIQFTSDDDLTILTFGAIGFWALAALYLTMYERPFSLNCTHWVFVLFFFSYAPLIQFLTQNFPGQADIGAFDRLHLQTNILLLVWCLCYSLTYRCLSGVRLKRASALPQGEDRSKPNYAWLILFTLFCTALDVHTFGFSHLFSREAAGDNTGDSGGGMSSPVALIVGTIGGDCPLGSLLVMLVSGRKRQFWYYVALVIVGACALITNFPPAISRFASGSMFISLICIALRRRRLPSLWLLLVFWLGFIIAMPFLNLFRQNSVQDAAISSYQQQDLQSVVTGGDFDAYMMLVATVSYGENPDNITWGRQLVGNLLFFVPRSMWWDKPGGSGTLVVQNTVLNFYNLSEPLPAEGYVNFGVAGLVLFAVAFGGILAVLDRKYWTELPGSLRRRPNLLAVIYPLLIGLVMFIMRGALLSTFAYSTAFVAGAYISLQVAYLRSGAKFGPGAKKIIQKSLSSVTPYAHQAAASLRSSRLHSQPRL